MGAAPGRFGGRTGLRYWVSQVGGAANFVSSGPDESTRPGPPLRWVGYQARTASRPLPLTFAFNVVPSIFRWDGEKAQMTVVGKRSAVLSTLIRGLIHVQG